MLQQFFEFHSSHNLFVLSVGSTPLIFLSYNEKEFLFQIIQTLVSQAFEQASNYEQA